MGQPDTHVVAIGGGDTRQQTTLAIDQEIVRLTGKARPRALFIPTASTDSESYWEAFREYYGGGLGCETDVLYLLERALSQQEIKAKIAAADLVYVGGGNTLKLMRRWRRLGVDRMLEEAWRQGTVLSGISAGAICWFKYGHSDSMSFYEPEGWKYIRVRGMGLINAIGVPHFNGEGRVDDFCAMVAKHHEVGIAIDDNCAVHFCGDSYRVLSSAPGAGAYRVYRRAGEVITERIPETGWFAPMSDLLPRRNQSTS